MADSKLQREYTLADALCDIAVGGAQDDTAKVERASQWVGTLVADLEKKVGHLEHLLTARTRNESAAARACPSVYTGPQGRLECDRPRGHGKFGHTATIRHADGEGAIGWDDTSQDGARCPVTAPKPCVLEIRHPGNHRSNSGTEWPSPMCDRGHIGCAKVHELLDVSGLCGHAHRWRSGVIYCDMERGHEGDHRAPGPLQERLVWDRDEPDAFAVRPAADSEAVCARQPLDLHADPSQRPTCVREMWHDGPHMDATAVAHYGKAGEVWE